MAQLLLHLQFWIQLQLLCPQLLTLTSPSLSLAFHQVVISTAAQEMLMLHQLQQQFLLELWLLELQRLLQHQSNYGFGTPAAAPVASGHPARDVLEPIGACAWETAMTDRLHGVFAAIATAVAADGSPDAARCIALARHLLDSGCDGLNVLGTTGEATSFSREQREGLMTAYRDAGLPVQRRINPPMVATIGRSMVSVP